MAWHGTQKELERDTSILFVLFIIAAILIAVGLAAAAIAAFWIIGALFFGGLIIIGIYNRPFRKDEMFGEDDNSLDEENK